jgi:hypothetical protein
MVNRRTWFGLAITLGFAVSVTAQSTTTTPKPSTPSSRSIENELNVVGCVSKTEDGRFTLTNARVEPAASATAKGSRPTEPAGSGPSGMTTWALEGGADLERHVGHEIQVTGRAQTRQSAASKPSSTATPSATGTTGSTAAPDEGHARTLEVQSIKMIATKCS